MSHFLIDEPPVAFQPSLAKAVGVDEAIILQQFHYWLRNPQMGMVIDGVRWIKCSAKDMYEGFMFFRSMPTINRAISNLHKSGILKSRDDIGGDSWDRSLWHTIDYEALDSAYDQNDQMQLIKMIKCNGSKRSNAVDQNDQMGLVAEEQAPGLNKGDANQMRTHVRARTRVRVIEKYNKDSNTDSLSKDSMNPKDSIGSKDSSSISFHSIEGSSFSNSDVPVEVKEPAKPKKQPKARKPKRVFDPELWYVVDESKKVIHILPFPEKGICESALLSDRKPAHFKCLNGADCEILHKENGYETQKHRSLVFDAIATSPDWSFPKDFTSEMVKSASGRIAKLVSAYAARIGKSTHDVNRSRECERQIRKFYEDWNKRDYHYPLRDDAKFIAAFNEWLANGEKFPTVIKGNGKDNPSPMSHIQIIKSDEPEEKS